ncbi:hypothetical protein LXL04_004054 [Taraxacum kok-saghyz]
MIYFISHKQEEALLNMNSVFKWLKYTTNKFVVGATALNERSSRSHRCQVWDKVVVCIEKDS